MARITINRPDIAHRPPNFAPEATEFGDTWDTTLANLNTMFTELFGGTSTVAGAKTYSGTAAFQGVVTVVPGLAATTTTGKPVLDLKTNTTAFSSANTNTSQTMFTYTVLANTLGTIGDGLFIESWGAVAGNAAAKSIVLNVGGATVTTGTFTSSGVAWSVDGYSFKTAANVQKLLLQAWQGTTLATSSRTSDTSVDTGTFNITVVSTDASAASADILGDALLVQFLPNN